MTDPKIRNNGGNPNIFLCPNTDKPHCAEYLKKASDILTENGCRLFAEKSLQGKINDGRVQYGSLEELMPRCDFVLVIGGDGTILKHAKKLAGYGKAILGLNCGRLGFMATLEHNELELLNDFCMGRYYVSERMTLKAEVFTASGETHSFCALNDVVFSKTDGCKISDFVVSKGDTVVSALRADGIVFSTPTGATAYSLSAGGPLIEPELECIEFTQICPHSLFARSMIFTPDSRLGVTFQSGSCEKVLLVVDGVNELYLSAGDRAVVSRSESVVRLIDITGDSFHRSISKKLMTPLKGV